VYTILAVSGLLGSRVLFDGNATRERPLPIYTGSRHDSRCVHTLCMFRSCFLPLFRWLWQGFLDLFPLCRDTLPVLAEMPIPQPILLLTIFALHTGYSSSCDS
jgi:hypothetical protein